MLMHPNTLGVASSKKARSRWRTNRRGDMEVGKLCSFSGKLIKVGCFDVFRTKAAKIGIALIVGKDDDKVRIT